MSVLAGWNATWKFVYKQAMRVGCQVKRADAFIMEGSIRQSYKIMIMVMIGLDYWSTLKSD